MALRDVRCSALAEGVADRDDIVADAERLVGDARRVGEGAEDVEDRADAELASRPGSVTRRGGVDS